MFRVSEFRALCIGEFGSTLGDQFARVAVVLLVFDRTGSAALAGLTYALTLVPNVIGAFALSGMADRLPRREVMVAVDVVRAVIAVTMAVSGVPLVVLCALVAAGSFLNGPHKAAQLALLRDILDAKQYPVGMALRQSVNQGAIFVGFASSGIVFTTLGATLCLLVDAVTFLLSAVLVARWVRPRPAPDSATQKYSMIAGFRIVWNGSGRRAVFLSTLLGVFLMAPDGVVAPYVKELDVDPAWVGFLLASSGVCSVIGLALFARFVPAHRHSVAFPIACVAAGLPLVLVHGPGGVYLGMIVFGVSGAIWAIQVVLAVSSLAEMLPDSQRAQGMGVAAAMNMTAGGLGTVIAGLVTQVFSATTAITLAGVGAALFALWPAALWMRWQRSSLPAGPTRLASLESP